MKRKIVVATRNKGKLAEYEDMLIPHGFAVFSLFDFQMDAVEETGETFLDNARLKAQAMRQHTREMIIADDSGLMVEALQGAPGVHSKRFSDEGTDQANNMKLLQALAQASDRRARFVTVIVLLLTTGEERVFYGELPGYIHTVCVGGNGFGYDPLFIPVGQTETLAELAAMDKNTMSHRARAFKQLLTWMIDESIQAN